MAGRSSIVSSPTRLPVPHEGRSSPRSAAGPTHTAPGFQRGLGCSGNGGDRFSQVPNGKPLPSIRQRFSIEFRRISGGSTSRPSQRRESISCPAAKLSLARPYRSSLRTLPQSSTTVRIDIRSPGTHRRGQISGRCEYAPCGPSRNRRPCQLPWSSRSTRFAS